MRNERRGERARTDDVKKVTKLMGGDIAVERAEGKGSKFTVTVPLSPKG